jgi:hypothetical protein
VERRLGVLVPSRGRPHNAHRLRAEWPDGVGLHFLVDADDPTVPEYPVGLTTIGAPPNHPGMVEVLNRAAVRLTGEYFALGFMGDDHLPHPGWEGPVLDALTDLGSGWVYGNDLVHGAGLPTAVFVTSDIVRTLGWMAPPALQHLYVDNAWLALGGATGRIRYLPDVVIEHLHPVVGKAVSDEGYERVNAESVYAHDGQAYEQWLSTSLDRCAKQVAAL